MRYCMHGCAHTNACSHFLENDWSRQSFVCLRSSTSHVAHHLTLLRHVCVPACVRVFAHFPSHHPSYGCRNALPCLFSPLANRAGSFNRFIHFFNNSFSRNRLASVHCRLRILSFAPIAQFPLVETTTAQRELVCVLVIVAQILEKN